MATPGRVERFFREWPDKPGFLQRTFTLKPHEAFVTFLSGGLGPFQGYPAAMGGAGSAILMSRLIDRLPKGSEGYIPGGRILPMGIAEMVGMMGTKALMNRIFSGGKGSVMLRKSPRLQKALLGERKKEEYSWPMQ